MIEYRHEKTFYEYGVYLNIKSKYLQKDSVNQKGEGKSFLKYTGIFRIKGSPFWSMLCFKKVKGNPF